MKTHPSLNNRERKCLKEFGSRVKAARLAKGWTLEDAEEHGWKSWQHLQQIESGNKNINLITLLRLLSLFELDANRLLDHLIP
jgi:transcriptional regulator with XRE-family HTH domain